MENEDEMDLLAIRAKNMAALNNMFGNAFSDAEKINEQVKNDLDDCFEGPKQPKYRRKRQSNDELFKFSGLIPLERRKSERLSNVKPKYSYADLDKVEGFDYADRADRDPDYYFDLEEVIGQPVKRRRISTRVTINVPIRMPEEITEQELNRIAHKSTQKKYSQDGTSCHQCRQKTLDFKTICRSRRCIGVRGQFCGPCLKNRYGEDAREVLLDPEWCCPPCRGLCNCSLCRAKEGKRPTGILAPTVQQEGYASVKDFLLDLAEKSFLGKYKNDEVIAAELSESVINAQIKSYYKKIRNNKLSYDLPNTNDLPQLVGFRGGRPVHLAFNDSIEGELLGFTSDKKSCCISSNNLLYLYHL